MKLQTRIPLDPGENRIDYQSLILLLGSCFTENIGNKLEYYKFQTVQNPFGIIFHPLAITALLERAIESRQFSEDELFYLNGKWQCFQAHSLLSHSDKTKCLNGLNQALDRLNKSVTNSTHLVITLGTAWAYHHLESDSLVANCHKVPQKAFEKRLLSADEIVARLESVISSIEMVNKDLSLILTVSPVRHLKDGFTENTRSKAHLISAVHKLMESSRGSYFPAYELMMDELRDYRFYSEDMLHPNNTAIEYIWDRFTSAWLSDETESARKEIEQIQQGLNHRPHDPESASYKSFREQLQSRIESIQQRFPHISF